MMDIISSHQMMKNTYFIAETFTNFLKNTI